MCGILGTTKKVSRQDFDTALSKITYRGPDDLGVIEEGGVMLGHRRLSIIDLSIAGHQPMTDIDKNYFIIFNGEIYNYKELKSSLLSDDCVFSSDSDTEVILLGYIKYGVDFFNKLRGMWAFAIYDKILNKIILSRDFFGIKPLYYSCANNTLSFCSELKPLADLMEFVPDEDAYKTYFYMGSMILDKTGVKNVQQVLPGEVIEYDLVSKQPKKYTLDINSNHESKYDDLESVLTDSIRFHYVSDVPVSLLFSGGIDSTIIATLSKKEGFNPTCFFVEMDDNNDKEYAKKIANNLGLKIETIKFDKNKLHEVYDDVLSKLDIPTSDISILPTFAVFKKVGNKAKVVLSGEGGDEFFGGYLRHKFLYNTKIRKSNALLPKLYKNNIFGLKYMAPIENRLQNQLNKIIKDTSIVYAMNSELIYDPIVLKNNTNLLNKIYDNLNFKDIVPNSLIFDISIYLPYMLMLKNDRASMMNSVEARVPFLDKNVFNYVTNYYKKNGVDNFYYKKELKKILEKYLPNDLIYREKQGFGVSNKIFKNKKVKDDFIQAFKFHKEREDLFGPIMLEDLNSEDFYDLIIDKYPRFAFGLITSFYVWKEHLL